jgi:von Willebrand factor type A C-terminal domain/von Willebrand factor type A domain
VASAPPREDARRAVNRLKAGGGTAIGRWIDLAAGLFGEGRGIHHAILLTDGKDEGESTQDLQRALDQASGRFQCDCRGVGTDWVVSELRGIAAALLGSVDIVADPSGLTDDFTSMMRNAMGKAVADVNLRLWTPQGAEIEFVKQVSPDLADLTESRIEVDEHSGDYPTGAWGDESRDYHVAIKVTAAGVGEEMLAGRVTLLVGDAPSGQSLVRAVWTEDTALSTRINRQVAHYTGQAELADAIQEGIVARRNGDVDEATAKLGRAVRLATESGNDQALQMLEQIVEIEDAATGKIAMKRKVDAAADLTIETRSTKTVRVKR